MAKRIGYKLPGLRTYVQNVKEVTAREAAAQIVDDLKQLGPYWTGTFERSWKIERGDVSIPKTTPSPARTPDPLPRQTTPTEVPPLRSGLFGRFRATNYTIGNTTQYREIAMDLAPGRDKGGRLTAESDWYRKYVEGGNLRLTLEQATQRASFDPRVKGYSYRPGDQ